MSSRLRLTAQTIRVLDAFLEDPEEWRYGYDISRNTGLKSGTLYPILMRLAEYRLLEASWEATAVGKGAYPLLFNSARMASGARRGKKLMSMTRRLASRVLTIVIRQSSGEGQLWGNAMLRELDFIQGDWAALFWAFGSTAALCRHSVTNRLRTLGDRNFNETFQIKRIAKKTTGI